MTMLQITTLEDFDKVYDRIKSQTVDLYYADRWDVRDIAIKLGVSEKFVRDTIDEFDSGDCWDYFGINEPPEEDEV